MYDVLSKLRFIKEVDFYSNSLIKLLFIDWIFLYCSDNLSYITIFNFLAI